MPKPVFLAFKHLFINQYHLDTETRGRKEKVKAKGLGIGAKMRLIRMGDKPYLSLLYLKGKIRFPT